MTSYFNAMKELNIAIIQSQLHWTDIDQNLKMFAKKIDEINTEEVDLIILPETFTTGFAMQKVEALAESMDGKTVQWLKAQAQDTDAVICGSAMIKENGNHYNRLLWVSPDGSISAYDKKHLFRLAYEQNYFTAGQKRETVEINDWKIRLNVCYDLRFPVWCRNFNNEYDVMLFVANWPESRIMHWNNLLKARAVENLSYVIGCNRIGVDGTKKNHTGDSAVILPDGTTLVHSLKEEILYATLSKNKLKVTRNRFQFYKDADEFELK